MRRSDWFPKTLFGRTLAFIALVVASGAVALAAIARHYAGVAAERAYDQLLSGAAIQVAENLYVQGGVLALNPPVAAFSTLSRYDVVYYKVVDSRGMVVAGYADLSSAAPLAAAQQGPTFEDGRYQHQRVRIATVARYMPEETVPGWAVITVAQTTHARQQLTNDMSVKVWTLIALMSVLAVGASGLAIKRGLRPLAQVETIIVARDPADLRPVSVDTPSEINALIGAINVLMQRLARRIASMQRFIADAAHQMRTPLARLDAQIELLSAETDAARYRERLASLRDTCADVGRLTGQLLNHAMVIHRSEIVALQPVELDALVKEVLGRTIPLADERDIAVAFENRAGAVAILGDGISLREALSNLLDNAISRGDVDEIVVSLCLSERSVQLTAKDNGRGIAREHWDAVLLPFVSMPSDGARKTGSGLGLAIVNEVMKAHGGSVTFGFPPEGGFAVTLRFPAP
ncbi:sensor histidine kinase [Trinickia caryophylli]|uniref:histidine kinase n=1 Tax=Trinickia caryophylli TaxID=28094 RepID=A0A1X7F219_TRICW|nr:sensor histidine kinase [Trinickia caryophylli]PMS10367.1 sensor histidine kinase [Trinickia caryophylli]TRX19509.1 sensor histidine kinase [Trinickia caryophylli]WQE13180.1 sensor histidine kinase [Trinickia caryophylli]SMF44471.1 two-component system, OmpR family, sensor histidine kinase TctE [Trinickia caryophylli]GLU34513.1 sensor histidine kinase [Trinickia caryophylli]